jgi:hypothetical protein
MWRLGLTGARVLDKDHVTFLMNFSDDLRPNVPIGK